MGVFIHDGALNLFLLIMWTCFCSLGVPLGVHAPMVFQPNATADDWHVLPPKHLLLERLPSTAKGPCRFLICLKHLGYGAWIRFNNYFEHDQFRSISWFHWISPGISDGVGAGRALREQSCLWFGDAGSQSQGDDGALILVEPTVIGRNFGWTYDRQKFWTWTCSRSTTGTADFHCTSFQLEVVINADRFADNFKSATCPATFFSERRAFTELISIWRVLLNCASTLELDNPEENLTVGKKDVHCACSTQHTCCTFHSPSQVDDWCEMARCASVGRSGCPYRTRATTPPTAHPSVALLILPCAFLPMSFRRSSHSKFLTQHTCCWNVYCFL